MAKKKAVATTGKPNKLQEQQADNEAQEQLVGILKSLDDLGVSIVEEQWRQMPEDENKTAIAWAAQRRIGGKSPIPPCLIPYATDELKAELEEYREHQAESRITTLPITFLKPSISKKDEDGERKIVMSGTIPIAACKGGELERLFRWKHCRIEFSERAVDQWGGLPAVEDSLPPAIPAAVDFSGFGATRHHSVIKWRMDETSKFNKDHAYDMEGASGSIRIDVLGDPKKGDADDIDDDEPDEEPPPKKSKAQKPAKNAQALPGTTPEDLTQNVNLSFTDKYNVDIKAMPTGDGRVSCEWSGTGPAGSCGQREASVRQTESQAAEASIGNAIDFWLTFDQSDAEVDEIMKDLRFWLVEVGKGKSLQLIDAECAAESEKA